MGLITLSEVKPGLKLGNDVQTLRGNVLFQKGKVILPKDVEVLRAFMIHQVDIEQENGDKQYRFQGFIHVFRPCR